MVFGVEHGMGRRTVNVFAVEHIWPAWESLRALYTVLPGDHCKCQNSWIISFILNPFCRRRKGLFNIAYRENAREKPIPPLCEGIFIRNYNCAPNNYPFTRNDHPFVW